MEEQQYGVASVSSESGSLHLWLRDGGARGTQSGCRPRSVASMSCVLHRGHLFSASLNPSESASLICAHALCRSVGGPVARCSAPEPVVTSVAVSPDGSLLVAGGESGRCYAWSLAAGVLVAEWDAHFRAVTRIAFTDDSETVLTAGADAAVFAYDVAQLVCAERQRGGEVPPVATLQGHSLPISALCVGFGGASARVLTASADRVARVWHLASARDIGGVLLSAPAVDAVFLPDESAAFLGLESGEIVVVYPAHLHVASTVSDRKLPQLVPPAAPGKTTPGVTALAVSPAGFELIAGYVDGHIRVYDVRTHVLLMTYAKHGDVPVTWLGVVPNMAKYIARDAGGGRGAVEGLLYEGPLGRSVDGDMKNNFRPKVTLYGESGSKHAWEAVDCGLVDVGRGGVDRKGADDMALDIS